MHELYFVIFTIVWGGLSGLGLHLCIRAIHRRETYENRDRVTLLLMANSVIWGTSMSLPVLLTMNGVFKLYR